MPLSWWTDRARSSSQKLNLHAAKAGGIFLLAGGAALSSEKLNLHAAKAGGISRATAQRFATCHD